MSLGQPWALALLLLAGPVVVLHLLRGNPRRQRVSATFLWRGLGQQSTARRSWRRPPRSLALLLQLLALCLGVLALARPQATAASGRQVVYLLDASPSMQATDVAPDRFGAAKAALRSALGGLGDGDRATVIRVAGGPEVIVEQVRPGEALGRIEAMRAGTTAPRMRDALVLAGQRLRDPIGPGSEIVVLSDGVFDEPTGLGPLPVPVRFVQIGQSGDNQGVSVLQVRRAGEDGPLAAFAQVTNYADRPTRLPVRITADGVLLETRLVDLPARGRAELPFDVPNGARAVAVALVGQDALSLDDRAEVTVPDSRRLSVLLVSRSPRVWQQALGALTGLTVETQEPDGYRDTGADLVLLDGFVPPRLPGGQLVVVNPPPDNQLVSVVGDQRGARIATLDEASPIVSGIDWSALRLARSSRLAVPGWGSSIADTPAGPLIVQGVLDGRRVIVLGFDPLASGMEKLIAFPVLVANTVGYLAQSGVEPSVDLGQIVSLPVGPGVEQVTLEGPDGTRTPIAGRGGAAPIGPFERVGRYTLRQRFANGQETARPFYVNLFGESLADIAPRPRPNLPASARATAGPVGGPSADAPLPWALAGLALLALTAEWLHFVRKG